jgi:hypothetical protein
MPLAATGVGFITGAFGWTLLVLGGISGAILIYLDGDSNSRRKNPLTIGVL